MSTAYLPGGHPPKPSPLPGARCEAGTAGARVGTRYSWAPGPFAVRLVVRARLDGAW